MATWNKGVYIFFGVFVTPYVKIHFKNWKQSK